jgi:hypothetical protein
LSKYLLRGSQHEKTSAPEKSQGGNRLTQITSPQGGD